jgi:hypothetical protein
MPKTKITIKLLLNFFNFESIFFYGSSLIKIKYGGTPFEIAMLRNILFDSVGRIRCSFLPHTGMKALGKFTQGEGEAP